MARKHPNIGGKRDGAGRPPGAGNEAIKPLREAIMEAAKNVGRDGKGKDGLVGYLVMLAKDEPKAFAGLLGRVIPMQVTGEDGGDIKITVTKVVHSARNNG